jgi:hypothetical protein
MFCESDLDALGETLRSAVVAVMARRDADPSASLSRADCMALFGHGLSKQISLEEAGVFVTFSDGGKRRIEKNSAYDRLIRLLIESNPTGQAPTKIRTVATRFQKKPRPRTPAELEGLRKGNETRRLKAERRRAAQATEPAS